MRRTSAYVLILILSLTFFSCSKKNNVIKRTYHNITAHYNGYFNARVKIDNAKKQSELAFQDKYDDILPIYKITKEETATGKSGKGGGNQSLDEAIKKLSLVIQRHEKSKWIDDCYFEIGRANFYKKDYFTAIETFQFVAGKYKGTETGDKAYVWLIRSYLQLNKLQQAESIINVAVASETFPKNQLADLYTAIAAYNIQKKNYPKAIEYLYKTTQLRIKKSDKARYTYINAQLNEKIEEDAKASRLYLQVLKYNPSYEMSFNANINSARLAQSNSTTSRKNLEKELLKMLKDSKNKEYKDQIYYSLGLIYEKEKNQDKAIQAYKTSSSNSTTNIPQKGKTYLKLATIYFNDAQYENAQLYYDSASTYLSKNHPEYDLVNERKNSLTKLVVNLNTIKYQDSLLRISRMPEKDRIQLVDNIIKQEKLAKEKKEQEEREQAENALSNMSKPNLNSGNAGAATVSGSIWYFYNQNAVSLGNSEFLKKWGKRPLEDHWRRSNKQSYASLLSIEESSNVNNQQLDPTKKDDENKLRKKYLSNIPLTPEAQQACTDIMVQAYYNIGQFYREEIINTRESINAYETALKRFPDNKLRPEIYYNLYRLYTAQKNNKQSEYYKNKLLNEFPNSLFSKVILDPSYTSEAKSIDKAAQVFYDSIYTEYKNGNYSNVLTYKSIIDSQYAATSIGPKYGLLYALAISKTNGQEALIVELNNVIKNYPSSDAASSARDILAKITEGKNSNKSEIDDGSSAFSTEIRGKFFVIICTDLNETVRDTKFNLQRFNEAEFSLQKLSITNELIDDQNQLILIKEFAELAKANEYISSLSKRALDVIAFKTLNYKVVAISESNYKTLIQKKNIKQYLNFYKKNFKSNEQ